MLPILENMWTTSVGSLNGVGVASCVVESFEVVWAVVATVVVL